MEFIIVIAAARMINLRGAFHAEWVSVCMVTLCEGLIKGLSLLL